MARAEQAPGAPRGRPPRTPPRTAAPARSRSRRDAAGAGRRGRGLEIRQPDLRRALGPDERERGSSSARRCAYAVPSRLRSTPESTITSAARSGTADEPVLERRAVEQDRRARVAEHARRLVEDPARDADRAQLGALARERELERLELEVRDRAEGERDPDLERGGGREPGPGRQVRVDGGDEPDRRAAEGGELRRDGLAVAAPAGRRRARPVGGERLGGARRGSR